MQQQGGARADPFESEGPVGGRGLSCLPEVFRRDGAARFGRPTRFGHLEPIDQVVHPTIDIAAGLTDCPLVLALLRSRRGDQ